jgi:hypothetical protein
MPDAADQPRVFNLLRVDATSAAESPHGSVGTLFSGREIAAVWVSKQGEVIDPGWFSTDTVDLMLVVQGRLRVEFAEPSIESLTLHPGDLLVLPPSTRCRAYRWPRDAEQATIFFAVYPAP